MLTKKGLLGACVLLLAAVALWWSVDRRSESDVSLLPLKREVEESLKKGREDNYEVLKREIFENFQHAAEILNERAPMPVGPSLQFKGARALEDGPSMTYVYVVDGDMVVGMESMDPVMREVCGNPEMSDYMQYGVFYQYVYENENGKWLMSFRVDEQTCKSLGPGPAPKSGSAPVPTAAPVENTPSLPGLGSELGITGKAPAMDNDSATQTPTASDAGGEQGEELPADGPATTKTPTGEGG